MHLAAGLQSCVREQRAAADSLATAAPHKPPGHQSLRGAQRFPRPQRLGNAPRLRDTTAGQKRRVAVENFSNAAKAAAVDGSAQWFEETLRGFTILIDAVVRQRERSE